VGTRRSDTESAQSFGASRNHAFRIRLRVQERLKMKLALYGKSCTGKTTVSNLLAEQLGVGARHCGDLVKEASIDVGCSPGALPISLHRQIDSQTRDVVFNATGDTLIEGAFLDQVFADVAGCILIRLTCSTPERTKRFALRETAMSLQDRDDSDERLRNELFSGARLTTPTIEIDTTELTPLETAKCIMEWLHQHKPGS